jgi:parallel beta-helix repeat protein
MTAAAALSLAATCFADVYYRILFERGIHVMEQFAYPEIALPVFQEIVNRHPYDRVYAARSQFFIGLCYKRMGSEEAYPAFRKAVTDFPEQTDVVRAAEAELVSLSPPQKPAVQEPAEKAERLIWKAAKPCAGGDVSANGRYFSSVDLETGDLKLHEIASGKTRSLTDFQSGSVWDEFAESPKFSPDGRRIAFGWKGGNRRSELRAVGVEGGKQTVLFRQEGIIAIHPAGWTADSGQILASLTSSDLTTRIVFISVSDGSVRPIKDMGSQWPDHLKLSPDGRSLAYALLEEETSPERDIYLYRIEEKNEIPLVVQPGDDLPLGWTADGKSLFCLTSRAGQTNVWFFPAGEETSMPSNKLVKADTGPIDPAGFSDSGTFYYLKKTEQRTASDTGRQENGLWALDFLQPKAGKILTVPDDYPTIQDAVSAAEQGDTVSVRNGVYTENIFIGKPLTLQGENRETTIIDGGANGDAVTITASEVSMSGLTVRNGNNGIVIRSSLPIDHNTLEDLIVTGNTGHGIFSRKTGGYHRIENCILSHNGGCGLSAHHFTRSVIRNCEIFQNHTGLYTGWSWYLLVEGNDVHHNTGGIGLDSCYDSTATGNIIFSNGTGISLHYISSRNTIKNNTIFDNKLGIGLGLQWSGVGGHRIYHNDFISNQTQINENKTIANFQYWDDGYPAGGNYWSDYTGQDINSDGIGDAPHHLLGEANDNYPLMKPRNRIPAAVGSESGAPNLGTKDDWIAVSIELPAGLPVKDIDVSTLRLNGTVSPEKKQFTIGDDDGDGIPDLKVRFSRHNVNRALQSAEDGVLAVSGNLHNGLPFQGNLSLQIAAKQK